ncbi:hypothetical protein VNO78_00136 [Psophocarpus tetragonolobus]|uniref:Uncharacterized protein n=1 Tax=Psophocarpus tetragonolobus TaxID=3891 RepID=A0AAN9SX15_PSOTE
MIYMDSSFLQSQQIIGSNASGCIHADFPRWFKEQISLGGCDPPLPPSFLGNKGKEKAKPKKLCYVIKVLSQPSFSQSPSSLPIPSLVSSLGFTPTSSPLPSSDITPTPFQRSKRRFCFVLFGKRKRLGIF